jgi:hypothetical protein
MKPLTIVAVVLGAVALAAGAKTRAPVIISVPERSSPSHAAIGSPCQKTWYQAVDGGAFLSYDRARPYITNLKRAAPDNDGKFTKAEFIDACKRGLVRL